jgi:protoporphyrinogen oxidase
VWEPLLAAKIGDRAAGLPALWLSSRMQREKSTEREVKGCLRGGYRSLIDALAGALERRGVELRLGARAEAIERDGEAMAVRVAARAPETFDAVVVTSALVPFQQMTRGLGLDPALAELRLDYQGVICAVFLLEQALSPYYWMPTVDSGVGCQGIVEMSNLMPLERSDGLHVAYLVRYAHRSSDPFRAPEDELLAAFRRDLEALFPEAARGVQDAFLFRAPFVEPIWSIGYRARRPRPTVLPGRLYLASTAQVYPRVYSWNSCCEVVEEMMPALQAAIGANAAVAMAGVA